jgi:hypothetical protein
MDFISERFCGKSVGGRLSVSFQSFIKRDVPFYSIRGAMAEVDPGSAVIRSLEELPALWQ